MLQLKVGQLVEYHDGVQAIVKYLGPISVSEGDWAGIAHDEPIGKNDGTIRGERYFDCPPGHGLFIKQSSIERVVQQPKEVATSARPNASRQQTATSTRSVTTTKTNTTTNPAPSTSATTKANAPATQTKRLSTVASRQSLKPTPITSSATSSAAASRRPTSKPPVAPVSAVAAGKRPVSTAQPVTSTAAAKTAEKSAKPRPSSVYTRSYPTSAEIKKVVADSYKKPSAPTRNLVRKPSVGSLSVTSPARDSSAPAAISSRPALSTSTSSASAKIVRDHTSSDAAQIQARLHERTQAEAREAQKELALVREENERIKIANLKLKEKLETMESELVTVTEKYTVAVEEQRDQQRLRDEFDANYEEACLDREMAEERAEQAEAEANTLRDRLEECELERDIAVAEAKLYTANMTEDERRAANSYRLHQESTRLREALMYLKEVKEQNERIFKERVRDLTEEVLKIESVQKENEDLKEQLSKTVEVIEHLQAQVDENSNWEEMIADLANRNQDLQEAVADKTSMIQELENLRQVTDELVEEQGEIADDLRAELDAKNIELTEQYEQNAAHQTTIGEYQEVISKYRDLIAEFHQRIIDANTSKTMTDTQIQDATARFNEVMDMNRRLRATAVDTTATKLEASLDLFAGEMAQKQVDIFSATGSREFGDSVAVKSYLMSSDISKKSGLLKRTFDELESQMAHNGTIEGLKQSLHFVSATYHLNILEAGSSRFASAMESATLPQFALYGSAYPELRPIDAMLDKAIDAIKFDQVNFAEYAGHFNRIVKIQSAILSSHKDALSALPHSETIFQAEQMAASLNCLNSTFWVINLALKALVESDLGDAIKALALRRIEELAQPIHLSKSAFQSGKKFIERLQSLKSNHLHPLFSDTDIEILVDETDDVADTVGVIAEWGQVIVDTVGNIIDGNDLQESNVIEFLSGPTLNVIAFDDRLDRISFCQKQLSEWEQFAALLKNNVEIERNPTPWALKGQELEAEAKKEREEQEILKRIAAEQQASRLKIAERDRIIDEKNVEIEHHKAKSHERNALAAENAHLRATSISMGERIESLKRDIAKLVAQNENMKREAPTVPHPARKDSTSTVESSKIKETRRKASRNQEVFEAAPALRALINATQLENTWHRRRALAESLSLHKRQLPPTPPRKPSSPALDTENMPPGWEDDIREASRWTTRLRPGDIPPLWPGMAGPPPSPLARGGSDNIWIRQAHEEAGLLPREVFNIFGHGSDA